MNQVVLKQPYDYSDQYLFRLACISVKSDKDPCSLVNMRSLI